MENILVIATVALILGCACGYIRKEKKKGAVCIGCPHAGTCAKCSGSCGGHPEEVQSSCH